MRPEDAETRLRSMLSSAGVELKQLRPEAAWEVFKAFAAEPVEGMSRDDESDMFLFECGVYDWSDGKGSRFEWSLTRQFSFYDPAGEYDHMEQLKCELFFEPAGALATTQTSGIWSGVDLAEWISAVEDDAGFKATLGLRPVESDVRQESV